MVRGVYVGLVLWVLWYAEVVVEFDSEFTGSVYGFVVEMVEASMSFDDVVDTCSVVTVEKWFIESGNIS